MDLEEKAEEILESLWIRIKEEKEDSLSLDELGVSQEGTIEQLLAAGYVSLSHGRVRLTEEGQPKAENVVRRHRLAERLLADVLDTRDMLIHEQACKFEHLLDPGLEGSICSLLGHPKVCPHGKPIPPGKCCHEEQAGAQRLVSPLSQLAPGQSGNIAYIYAPESSKLRKLMSMGILPGVPITLVQGFPSYVFQARQTQFAVDREIAEAIYVRLLEEEAVGESRGEGLHGHRWRWGRLGRRLGLR